MPRLFLSYRREDTGGYAGRLGDGLSARFGRSQIFRDIDAIPPGVNFVKGTDDAIAACDYVLLLIGDNWLSAATKAGDRRLEDPDDFVRREIEAAIKGDVPIIPILVEGARMPTAAELPPTIASVTYFNALELADTRWDYDFNKLVGAVSRKPSGRAVPQLRQRLSSWKRRPLQIAAGVVVIALLGLGYALLTGGSQNPPPSPPPANVDARVVRVELRSPSERLGDYLRETKQSTAGLSKFQGAERGYVFNARVRLQGKPGRQLPLRWSMIDASTGNPLRDPLYTQTATIFKPSGPNHARTWPFWVPYPPRKGRYRVRATLIDEKRRPLDEAESEPFTLAHAPAP
jgi:TIR domain-containing protein